jgi:hypothetical protein
MFPTQKSKFGYILEGLAMEDVGIFDRHLVYFTGDLVYFVLIWYIFPILVCCSKKIWQPRVPLLQVKNSFLVIFDDFSDDLMIRLKDNTTYVCGTCTK